MCIAPDMQKNIFLEHLQEVQHVWNKSEKMVRKEVECKKKGPLYEPNVRLLKKFVFYSNSIYLL